MTVIDSETALYAALKFLPEGATLIIRTRDKGQALTNIVAELRKEPGGGWDDWQVLKRPSTADASLLPSTFTGERPELVSSRSLADALVENPELWASYDD